MQKQKALESVKAKKSYSLGRKTAAFFKGLNRFMPLIEVAWQGLCNGYGLPAGKERAYAKRIAGLDRKELVFTVLESKVSDKAQEIITNELRDDYARRSHIFMRAKRISHPKEDEVWAANLVNAAISDGRAELAEIRDKARRLLEESILTSAKARKNLQNIVDESGLNF